MSSGTGFLRCKSITADTCDDVILVSPVQPLYNIHLPNILKRICVLFSTTLCTNTVYKIVAFCRNLNFFRICYRSDLIAVCICYHCRCNIYILSGCRACRINMLAVIFGYSSFNTFNGCPTNGACSICNCCISCHIAIFVFRFRPGKLSF